MRVLITDMGDETTAETEVPTIRLAKSGREIPVAWRTGIVGVKMETRAFHVWLRSSKIPRVAMTPRAKCWHARVNDRRHPRLKGG